MAQEFDSEEMHTHFQVIKKGYYIKLQIIWTQQEQGIQCQGYLTVLQLRKYTTGELGKFFKTV